MADNRQRKARKSARREVQRSFEQARQSLSEEQARIQGQIDAQKAVIESGRQQIRGQERRVSTTAAVRGLTKQTAVQRRQFLGGLSQAKKGLNVQEQQVQAQEVKVKQQFAKVREELKKQEEAETRRAIQSVDRAFEPQTTVTVTTIGPQFLDPVRVIDTDRGPVTVRGKGAFDIPVSEVLKRAGKTDSSITQVKIEQPKTTLGTINQIINPFSATNIRRVQRQQAIRRAGATAGFGLASDIVSAATLRGASLFPSKQTIETGQQLEARSRRIREQFKPSLIPSGPSADLSKAQAQGFVELREFREGTREAKAVAEQQKKDVVVVRNVSSKLEDLSIRRERLNAEIESKNRLGGFTEKGVADIEKRQEKLTKEFDKIKSEAEKKGIKFKQDGEDITITSAALEKEVGTGAIKQLGFVRAIGGSTKVRVAGALTSEAVGAVGLGLASGGFGAGAGIISALPKAVKIGGLAVIGGSVLASAGVSGFRGFKEGSARQVGIESAVLTGGEPIVRTAGFVGGGFAAGKIKAAEVTRRTLEGGRITEIGTKIGAGQKGSFVTTQQTSRQITNILGTKTKVIATSKLTAAETRKSALGFGKITTKITGGGLKGKATSDIFFVRKGASTGAVVVTPTKKGFTAQAFRILTTPTSKSKQVITPFKTIFQQRAGVQVEKLGPSVFIKAPKGTTAQQIFDIKSIQRLTSTRLTPPDVPFTFGEIGQKGTAVSGEFFKGFTTGGVIKQGGAGTIQRLTSGAVSTGRAVALQTPKPLFVTTFPIPTLVKPPVLTAIGKGAARGISPKTLLPTSSLALSSALTKVGKGIVFRGGLATGFGSVAFVSAQPQAVSLSPSQAQIPAFKQTERAKLDTTVTTIPTITPIQTGTSIQITPQITPTTPATTIQTTTTTPTIPTPITPPTPIITGFRLGGGAGISRASLTKIQRAAYDVFVKSVKSKKFRKVADDLPLGKALKKGATVTKRTIASQFKVVRDRKARTTKQDVNFTPNPAIFRNFKIVGGRQVPLPRGPDVYQYIERKRKRLTTRAETGEIALFRRRKGKNVFGF